jgi:hypothetical protein
MKHGIRNTRALPEIGWGGGEWIEFSVEEGNNFGSIREAKRSKAKRERRERVIRSDWEPGFRARVKAIAIANEVAKVLFSELRPGSEATCEVIPRPVLVAEGGGWICSSPGCHDLHEPDPSYRHLTDSELADLRQPTSSVEVWGSADFVGESFFSEPARRLQPISTYPTIPLRKRAQQQHAHDPNDDESGTEYNPMLGMLSGTRAAEG